ncbi:iron complex transport system substrate-binding protein [Polaromonas sp. OV174]|uniref:cobalamin-binding protein n=1 Tax=Polaromonas sp. OV174 TaxID=1855300 RepID=UPI0008E91941|nr:cobalamin-binding protein [Polaromonas sp. OV174]SFB94124.1 iron complex transport system substrate-binding protein [Polaromonas sp. OV174]
MTDMRLDWRALAASAGGPASGSAYGPQRIVCLTEEPTEWLYLLGEERRIVGISGYTVRPPRARDEKPKVSAYLSAKIDKIVELQPDCVIGFSDLQADIASQLIKKGIQVTIFNQRSVAEIFSMMYQLAAMVGQVERGLALIQAMQNRLLEIERAAAGLKRRPRVYFEEWHDPHISCIAWVSELIGIAGGDDCFPELAKEPMGKGRIIADGGEIVRRDPDIIFGSWCGKKFRPEMVVARPGWENVAAVKNQQLFEIKSSEILQPGPASLTDGVEKLHKLIMAWSMAPTLVASRTALPPEGAAPPKGGLSAGRQHD